MTLPIITLIFLLLALASLVAGVVIMAYGGKINKKFSTKLMTARVAFQALAVICILLAMASA